MSPLHFQGRADAYLEWAVASGFAWVGNTQPGSGLVSVLVDNGTVEWRQVSEQALRTGPAACPAGHWMELAQAVDDDPPINPWISAWTAKPACPADKGSDPVVLACIDSGLGRAWWSAWQQANAGRRLCHWDMDMPAHNPLPHASHGAHVLSWLAGQPPYQGGGFDTDTASRCPLVVVNLPRDAVQDPTGRWLGRYVLQALDFAVAQAQALNAKRLVVNLSWGPQTGPHDGSSLLEQALAQRMDAAAVAGLQVDVVLAAGNSREARAHAQWDARTGCDELVWAVPPASRVPFFLELWWPAATPAEQMALHLTPPSGQALHLQGPGVFCGQNICAVLLPQARPGQTSRPMALLALNPTGAGAQAAAHGRWRVGVPGAASAPGQVHAYVARQTANLGGRYRGPDSYLDVSHTHQPRSPRHPLPTPGAPITPAGTLSGLATAAHSHMHVASGVVLSTREPARYASEGPALSASPHQRPDWALPTDETPLLRGLLGAGSRPGSVLRLVGTSMAAPQLARWLTNATPLPVPSPHHPRTGYGVLPPVWRSRQRA